MSGVKAVAEEIAFKYGDYGKKNDTEIANEVLKAWQWNREVPEDKIKVKVENGWVTLEGELEWIYQRAAAKKAIKNLSGVMGVISIKIKSETHDAIEKKDIECALERNLSIDDLGIQADIMLPFKVPLTRFMPRTRLNKLIGARLAFGLLTTSWLLNTSEFFLKTNVGKISTGFYIKALIDKYR